jgi:hypothetical protein
MLIFILNKTAITYIVIILIPKIYKLANINYK